MNLRVRGKNERQNQDELGFQISLVRSSGILPIDMKIKIVALSLWQWLCDYLFTRSLMKQTDFGLFKRAVLYINVGRFDTAKLLKIDGIYAIKKLGLHCRYKAFKGPQIREM